MLLMHLDNIYKRKNFAYILVGEERIELSLLAKHDFESCASTNSAIRPKYKKYYLNNIRTKIILKTKKCLLNFTINA